MTNENDSNKCKPLPHIRRRVTVTICARYPRVYRYKWLQQSALELKNSVFLDLVLSSFISVSSNSFSCPSLRSRYTATLSRTCFWNRAKKPMLEGNAWITVHFHSPAFQKQTRRLTQTNTTAEGFSFSLHKNYKLGPTYPWLVLNFFSGRITSKESVCFEGWNKFSVPIWSPRKPNLTYRRRRRQLGLLSIKFDFRNVIFQ